MKSALKLVGDVVARRLPLRVFLYAGLHKIHLFFSTGNERYSFERLYAGGADPWNYTSSAYEREKYARTRDCILRHRNAANSALEFGSSIGAFSEILGDYFEEVTGVDFSIEATNQAIHRNKNRANVRFIRSDIRELRLGKLYDVITAAEILYYFPVEEMDNICDVINRHLSRDGIIVYVAGHGSPVHWEEILTSRFRTLSKQIEQSFWGPYLILVLAR